MTIKTCVKQDSDKNHMRMFVSHSNLLISHVLHSNIGNGVQNHLWQFVFFHRKQSNME